MSGTLRHAKHRHQRFAEAQSGTPQGRVSSAFQSRFRVLQGLLTLGRSIARDRGGIRLKAGLRNSLQRSDVVTQNPETEAGPTTALRSRERGSTQRSVPGGQATKRMRGGWRHWLLLLVVLSAVESAKIIEPAPDSTMVYLHDVPLWVWLPPAGHCSHP